MPPTNYIRTTDRILSSGGKIVSKGFNAYAKQNASVARVTTQQVGIMELMQEMNSSMAQMHHLNRRSNRGNEYHLRLVATGQYPGVFERLGWWLVDYQRYLLELIWGFFEPILTMILMTILRIVLVIVFSVIIYGGIYLLLTG